MTPWERVDATHAVVTRDGRRVLQTHQPGARCARCGDWVMPHCCSPVNDPDPAWCTLQTLADGRLALVIPCATVAERERLMQRLGDLRWRDHWPLEKA